MEILNFLSAHWGVLSSITLVVAGASVMFLTTKFVRRNECVGYRDNLVDKQMLDNMPTTESMHQLKLKMEKLSGRLDVANKEMQGHREILNIVKAQTDRIEGYLREHQRTL